jgi:amidase
MAGPRDPRVGASLQPPRREKGPAGLRVALWLDEPFAPVQGEVAEAVRRAARLLAEAGAIVDERARPAIRFEEAFEVFALLNHFVVAYGLPPKIRASLQAAAAAFAPGDLSHRALQARGARMSPGLYQQTSLRKQRLARQWAKFFQGHDVVLCPPAPVVAIPHDPTPDIHARTLDIDGVSLPYLDFLHWGSLATAADLPAAVAPVMRTASGLPAGVQIIAAAGEDRTAVAVAAMLEGARLRLHPATAGAGEPRRLDRLLAAKPRQASQGPDVVAPQASLPAIFG